MINVVLALMVIISFLFAIPLHECGHALMASWLGDRTPRSEGRLSLSIPEHIDPLGTLMCVILAFQPGFPVGLGWGKPVKADPWKMRVGANTGVLLVAIAGPIFSLLVGLVFALIVRFIPASLYVEPFLIRIPQFLLVFAVVNICLAIFNIIPLYPLDGYQVLYTLLPSRQAVQYAKSVPYGPLIILAIFFLLPFLAQFAGLASFPLFQLPFYIWMGGMKIAELASGLLPTTDILHLYLYNIPH
ncbi:MAG: site-2 protease family protein [Chloroflexi bacterium]|nr:MAG: site-2 protease family protein [Chloroflexota bacterium]